MTYVKKRAQILYVDDSEVPKYQHNGFEVFIPPKVTAGGKNAKDGK